MTDITCETDSEEITVEPEQQVTESSVTGGAELNYTFSGDLLELDLTVDDDSYLELHLKDGITYEGMITINATGETDDESSEEYDIVYVVIDENCIWRLTGDSVISKIELNGTIEYNGYTVTLADGTVLTDDSG